MAIISYIDGLARKIYLNQGVTKFHPIDIYKEMRTLRSSNETLRSYDVFLKAYGNIPKGGGKATERYVQTINGTKIVPYNDTHTLTVTGTIITDDGYEGVYCFDRTNLTHQVDINYVPPQVEVITVSSGSGLSVEEHDKLMSVPTAIDNANAVLDSEI